MKMAGPDKKSLRPGGYRPIRKTAMATALQIATLARGRAGERIEPEPISYIRETTYFEYTARELEQDLAYDSALDDLRALRSQWQAENAARVELKALSAKWQRENARQATIREWLELKPPVRRVPNDAIVTSAPDTSWIDAEPFELTRLAPDPFPLSRPVLKGKVGKKRRCVIPALKSFFEAASIFLHS